MPELSGEADIHLGTECHCVSACSSSDPGSSRGFQGSQAAQWKHCFLQGHGFSDSAVKGTSWKGSKKPKTQSPNIASFSSRDACPSPVAQAGQAFCLLPCSELVIAALRA